MAELLSSEEKGTDPAVTDPDLLTSSMTQSVVVVAGEAPESDDELDEAEALKDNPHASDDSPLREFHVGDDNPDKEDTSLKYNTLLHKRLRDKNEQLKKELSDLACQPYNSATKEIGSLTKKLVQSQKLVQGVSTTLRKVSRDLFLLEDTLNAIRADRSLLTQALHRFDEAYSEDSPVSSSSHHSHESPQ